MVETLMRQPCWCNLHIYTVAKVSFIVRSAQLKLKIDWTMLKFQILNYYWESIWWYCKGEFTSPCVCVCVRVWFFFFFFLVNATDTISLMCDMIEKWDHFLFLTCILFSLYRCIITMQKLVNLPGEGHRMHALLLRLNGKFCRPTWLKVLLRQVIQLCKFLLLYFCIVIWVFSNTW